MDTETLERIAKKLEESGVYVGRYDKDPTYQAGIRAVYHKIPWDQVLLRLVHATGWAVFEVETEKDETPIIRLYP